MKKTLKKIIVLSILCIIFLGTNVFGFENELFKMDIPATYGSVNYRTYICVCRWL